MQNKRIFLFIYLTIFLSAVSIFLLVFRFHLRHNHVFAFLAWNLFLAYIPLIIGLLIFLTSNKHEYLKIILFVIWLVFYPNAPYIFTDFKHLSWSTFKVFDFILMLFYSVSGLLAGLVSLYLIYLKLFKRLGKYYAWFVIFICSVLSGFGIYLGRYLRFNTWDLLTDFKNLLNWIGQTFIRADLFKTAIEMTFVFAVIHFIVFYLFYKCNK